MVPRGSQDTSSLLETPLEVDAVDMPSLHGLLHVELEGPPVALELSRSLLIQGVFRVGLQEEVLEAVHNGVDGEDGFPVLAKNVEAHVSLQINVRVINLSLTFHLWRFVRVGVSYLEAEGELSVSVKALIRKNDELKVEEIISVWKLCFTSFGKFELVDIFGDSELSGGSFFLRAASSALLSLLLLQREKIQHFDCFCCFPKSQNHRRCCYHK